MKRLLLLILLLPLFAKAQNTVTLPTPTTAYTPQFRYYGAANDTLKNVYMFSGSVYNQIYTATQIAKLFRTPNSIFTRRMDSLFALSAKLGENNTFTGINTFNGSTTSIYHLTIGAPDFKWGQRDVVTTATLNRDEPTLVNSLMALRTNEFGVFNDQISVLRFADLKTAMNLWDSTQISKTYLNNSYDSTKTTKSYFVNAVANSYITPYHAAEGGILSLGGDSVINFFRLNKYYAHQGDSGKAVIRLSLDKGKTWSTPTQFYNSTYDIRVKQGLYIPELNRIVVFMTRVSSGTTVDVGFMYSDDRMATWSAYTSLSGLLTYTNGQSAFGQPFKYNNEYLKVIQGIRWAQILKSPDGITWSSKSMIYDYTVSNTLLATNELNIATNGIDSLVAQVRTEQTSSGYTYYQFKSLDAITWTYVGTSALCDGVWGPSPALFYDKKKKNIINIATRRGNTSVDDAVTSGLYVYTAKFADVFNNANGWTLLTKIPRPSPNKYVIYGYPTATWMPSGDLLSIFTDRVLRPYSTGINSNNENASLYQFTISANGQLLPNEDVNEGYLYYNKITGKYETRRINTGFAYAASDSTTHLANPGRLDIEASNLPADTSLITIRNASRVITHKFKVNGDHIQVVGNDSTNTQYATRLHVNGTARLDLGSDATGDMLYRKSNSDLGRLGIGSTSQILSVVAGLPAWTTPAFINNGTAPQTADFNITGTAQAVTVRGGTGGTFSVPDGAGSNFSPNFTNTQTSGVAGIGVSVLDGTNNPRIALIADNTNGVVGLGVSHSSNAPKFVIRNAAGAALELSAARLLKLPAYTTAGVLINNTSGDVSSTTSLPSGTSLNGVAIITSSGTQTITNKTLTSPVLTTVKPASTFQTPLGTGGTDSVVVKTSLGLRAISPTYYGVDANNVHKTGTETVGGLKTFTSFTQFDAGVGVGTTASAQPVTWQASATRTTSLYAASNGTSNTVLYLPTSTLPSDTLAKKTDLPIILRASATLDFTSTAAQTSSELTITVTGAADGDVVSLGVPNAATSANSCFTAWVSATNTVTVKFNNYSSGAIDPTSGTFKVTVFK